MGFRFLSRTVIVITLGAAAGACGTKNEQSSGSVDSTRQAVEARDTVEHSAPVARESAGEIFRGYLVMLPEGSSLKVCGSEEKSWIVDLTAGELSAVYAKQATNPGDPVFVEFRGILDPAPSVGFGAGYANQLTILELRHAALEGRGCNEDLQAVEFRARGNEPFWSLDIAKSGMVFSDFGRSIRLAFPYAAPKVSSGRWRYVATAGDGGEHRIAINIERDPCTDSMSGAYFTFTVEVDVDGSPYIGCAMQGWATTPPRSSP
jgi:uncharacterized membrane protein